MRQIRYLLPLLGLVLILAGGGIRDAGAQDDTLSDLFGRGAAAQAEGNHPEAARIFREVLDGFEHEGLTTTPDAGLVWTELGESLLAIGDPEADKAFDRALALLRRASDMGPYFDVSVALAEVRLTQGRKGDAATLAEGIMSRASMKGVPESALAQAIDTSALIFRHAEHHDKADATLDIALNLTGTDQLTSSLRGIARMLRARRAQTEGRFARMEEEITLGLVDLERAGPGAADTMAAMLLFRAQLRFSEGRYRAALDETDAAYSKVVEAKLPEGAWIEAISLRVRLLERLDRTAEAVSLADEMVATLEKAHGPGDDKVMMARLMRVECLLSGLRHDEARAELAALAPMLETSSDPLIRPAFELRRGDLALIDGDTVAALAAAKTAYDVSIKAFPNSPKAIILPLRLRASATNASDDVEFAELAHRELLEESARAYGTTHPEYADDLGQFASWLANRYRLAESESLFRNVSGLIEASYGADSAKFAESPSNITTAFDDRAGRTEEAAALIERALKIVDRLGDLPRNAAYLRFNLAGQFAMLGRYQEALDLTAEARQIYLGLPGDSKPMLFMFDITAMQSLAALGRLDEALEYGLSMANTTRIDTLDDLQSYIGGLSELARVASVAGEPELAMKASRRAMQETSRLGHETGSAYKASAGALARSAWHLSQIPASP